MKTRLDGRVRGAQGVCAAGERLSSAWIPGTAGAPGAGVGLGPCNSPTPGNHPHARAPGWAALFMILMSLSASRWL